MSYAFTAMAEFYSPPGSRRIRVGAVSQYENVIVVSNRGPASFRVNEDGKAELRRGGGGLSSGLADSLTGSGASWFFAPMSDEEQNAFGVLRSDYGGTVEHLGINLEMVDIDRTDFTLAYQVISNSLLWFALHGMFDPAHRPRINRPTRQSWEAYCRVNEAFADQIARQAKPEAKVLVHDYHLFLVGELLASRREDLKCVHFTHTPFCSPTEMQMLPDEISARLTAALGKYSALGFHSPDWAVNYAACSQALGVTPTKTFVAPLPISPSILAADAASAKCTSYDNWLSDLAGGRSLVVRVDRVEPSKNILRGFHAFDSMLDRHPELASQVLFLALVYPSREALAEYLSYRGEIETLASYINSKWAPHSPISLYVDDNFERSLSALRHYDVLVVNPIRDGLNLVAKEGPAVNESFGTLVLSKTAGAHRELTAMGLSDCYLAINPFDSLTTGEAIYRALTSKTSDRKARSQALKAALADTQRQNSAVWLDAQVAAAE